LPKARGDLNNIHASVTRRQTHCLYASLALSSHELNSSSDRLLSRESTWLRANQYDPEDRRQMGRAQAILVSASHRSVDSVWPGI